MSLYVCTVMESLNSDRDRYPYARSYQKLQAELQTQETYTCLLRYQLYERKLRHAEHAARAGNALLLATFLPQTAKVTIQNTAISNFNTAKIFKCIHTY